MYISIQRTKTSSLHSNPIEFNRFWRCARIVFFLRTYLCFSTHLPSIGRLCGTRVVPCFFLYSTRSWNFASHDFSFLIDLGFFRERALSLSSLLVVVVSVVTTAAIAVVFAVVLLFVVRKKKPRPRFPCPQRLLPPFRATGGSAKFLRPPPGESTNHRFPVFPRWSFSLSVRPRRS